MADLQMARRLALPLPEAAPGAVFDDDHYRGFPAVLARLGEIEADELGALLRGTWRLQAPKTLVEAFDAARAG